MNRLSAFLMGVFLALGIGQSLAQAGDIQITAALGDPPAGTPCTACVGYNITVDDSTNPAAHGYFTVQNNSSDLSIVGFSVSDPNARDASTDLAGWHSEVLNGSYVYFETAAVGNPATTGGVFTIFPSYAPDTRAIQPGQSADEFEFESIQARDPNTGLPYPMEWDISLDPDYTVYAVAANGDLLSCSGSTDGQGVGSCDFSSDTTSAPEPLTLALFCIGFAGLRAFRR